MYVDESGDPGQYRGFSDGNSKHYILSGIVVHIRNWNATFNRLQRFRSYINKHYGLSIREEIHAAELIRVKKLKAYRSIRKRDRVAILHDFMRYLPGIFANSLVINVCIHKPNFPNVRNFQTLAWHRLANRYDQTLKRSLGNAQGVIVSDSINDPAVRLLLRRMRTFSPNKKVIVERSAGGPVYNMVTDNIIEDLFSRDSANSYFIQAVDAIAHCLYRKEYPKGSLRKFRCERFFDLIEPMLFKAASNSDPLGIVRS